MDFQLDEGQSALVAALQAILANFEDLPQSARSGFSHYDPRLQRLLSESGFLDAGRDMDGVAAALVAIAAARSPVVVEAAASAIVLPMLADDRIDGPVALIDADGLHKAQRFLPVAGHAIVDCGADVVILPVAADAVVPVETIFAYPYGRFTSPPDLRAGRRLPGAGPRLRQWWRVAIAAEIAGAARRATEFTIDYVTQRHVLGKPVGAYQSVQHRLAQCHGYALSTYYLTLRAAWSGRAVDADVAACFALQGIGKLLFDLHQFNGAMGVTNEHLLHLWTYRIRALQAEAGGLYGAALSIADGLWAADAAPRAALGAVR